MRCRGKIGIPSPQQESMVKFTVVYRVQNPKKIRLHSRLKVSPKFSGIYGVLYWLNKIPYHVEYAIFRSDKDTALRKGIKKMGERVI